MARKRRQQKAGSSSMVPRGLNPPTFNAYPPQRRIFRFQGSVPVGGAQSNPVVTRACLLSLLVATPSANSGATALVLTPIIGGIRIRSLKVWQPGTAAASPSAVVVEWLSDTGMPTSISRQTLGANPEPVVTSPPRGSRAAQPSRAGAPSAVLAEPLFTINVDQDPTNDPAQATPVLIDLTCDVTYNNDTASYLTTTNTATSSAVLIALTGMPLDSLSTSNTVGTLALQPRGLLNAFIDSGLHKINVTALTRTG